MSKNTILKSALDVAKYFIGNSKKGISNKKLQKLLYYAQVWSLVEYNKKLFPEKIEAWVHGSVVNEVYQQYKQFGFDAIDEKQSIHITIKKAKKLLDDILIVYGKHSAFYLELLTHSEPPWQMARNGLDVFEPSRNVIDLDYAKKFYKDLRNSKS